MPAAMTAKQHIYYWMLMKITDYRAVAAYDAPTDENRKWLKNLALQADLLHGIPAAIVSPEITDEDVVFLNRHARYFFTKAEVNHENYRFFKLMVHELFALVASQRASELEWPGPVLTDEERQSLDSAAE